jgi:hypothetical protein
MVDLTVGRGAFSSEVEFSVRSWMVIPLDAMEMDYRKLYLQLEERKMVERKEDASLEARPLSPCMSGTTLTGTVR